MQAQGESKPQAQAPVDPTAAPPPLQKLDKEQKRKLKKTLKELDTPYKQWLNEDVIYIISPEERQAFLQRRARTIHRAILAAPQRESGFAR
jgi:hypothetical protein